MKALNLYPVPLQNDDTDTIVAGKCKTWIYIVSSILFLITLILTSNDALYSRMEEGVTPQRIRELFNDPSVRSLQCPCSGKDTLTVGDIATVDWGRANTSHNVCEAVETLFRAIWDSSGRGALNGTARLCSLTYAIEQQYTICRFYASTTFAPMVIGVNGGSVDLTPGMMSPDQLGNLVAETLLRQTSTFVSAWSSTLFQRLDNDDGNRFDLRTAAYPCNCATGTAQPICDYAYRGTVCADSMTYQLWDGGVGSMIGKVNASGSPPSAGMSVAGMPIQEHCIQKQYTDSLTNTAAITQLVHSAPYSFGPHGLAASILPVFALPYLRLLKQNGIVTVQDQNRICSNLTSRDSQYCTSQFYRWTNMNYPSEIFALPEYWEYMGCNTTGVNWTLLEDAVKPRVHTLSPQSWRSFSYVPDAFAGNLYVDSVVGVSGVDLVSYGSNPDSMLAVYLEQTSRASAEFARRVRAETSGTAVPGPADNDTQFGISVQVHYNQYFDACAPTRCQYLTNTFADSLRAAVATVAGVSAVLNLVVSIAIDFCGGAEAMRRCRRRVSSAHRLAAGGFKNPLSSTHISKEEAAGLALGPQVTTRRKS